MSDPVDGWDGAVFTVALEEGRRGVDQQREDLKSLRDRGIALLSVAGIAASFLGGLAFRSENAPITLWTIAGIASFALVAILVAILLWPRSFAMTNEATVIVSWATDHGADVSRVERNLALFYDSSYKSNQKALFKLLVVYEAAIALVAVEVITLLVDLRGR